MEPTSRSSFQEPYLYPQTPSVTSINTGVEDVILTIEPSGSSNQVCMECSQPILSSRSSLDDRAKTQAQRVCDICTRAIAQNQNLPVAVADPVVDDSVADGPVVDDYDDDCKRKLKCAGYVVAAVVAAIGVWLITLTVSDGDAISS